MTTTRQAQIVVEYLYSKDLFVLKYPPNSPDLSLCGLWFFGVMKRKLPGGYYDCGSALGSALYQCQNVANFDDLEKSRYIFILPEIFNNGPKQFQKYSNKVWSAEIDH